MKLSHAELGSQTLRPAGLVCTICLQKQGVVSGMFVNPWVGHYTFSEEGMSISVQDGVVVTLLSPYPSSQLESLEDKFTEILDRVDRYALLEGEPLTLSLYSKQDKLILEPATANDGIRIKEAQRQRQKRESEPSTPNPNPEEETYFDDNGSDELSKSPTPSPKSSSRHLLRSSSSEIPSRLSKSLTMELYDKSSGGSSRKLSIDKGSDRTGYGSDRERRNTIDGKSRKHREDKLKRESRSSLSNSSPTRSSSGLLSKDRVSYELY